MIQRWWQWRWYRDSANIINGYTGATMSSGLSRVREATARVPHFPSKTCSLTEKKSTGVSTILFMFHDSPFIPARPHTTPLSAPPLLHPIRTLIPSRSYSRHSYRVKPVVKPARKMVQRFSSLARLELGRDGVSLHRLFLRAVFPFSALEPPLFHRPQSFPVTFRFATVFSAET